MRTRLPALALLLALSAAASVPAAESRAAYDQLIAKAGQQTDAERLNQLFEIDWQRGLRNSPEFATSLGIPGEDDRWTDMSQAAIEERQKEAGWPWEVLKTIDRSKLPAGAQLNYDLFRRGVEQELEDQRFPSELMPINQLGGVQLSVAQVVEQMPRTTTAQYENILARLRSTPRLIEQNLDLLRRGLAAGLTPPRVILRNVPAQILKMIPAAPLASPLLAPFTTFPSTMPAADQSRLRAEAVQIYHDQLTPAFQKLHDYLVVEYIPRARQTVGWDALPDGAAWYQLAVREHTTTDLTPAAIHELGLREVARIRGEMDKVIADSHYQGTFQQFTTFLRTDPRFYCKTPDELLAGYRDIAKRIDPELPRFFYHLPRLTYGVKAIQEYAAESAPAAYYESGSEKAGRPGWFCANTSHLESRPKWQMETLTLHESVPGHHLQLSLAQELSGVPEFRKYSGYTAFVEGWALYCESLGGELGFYKDPYSQFGKLTFEMWRADRLVIDTGLHSQGWTRQQAIEYLEANTGKDEHEATVEVDRYIASPGQALAYKIGQLRIRALRDEATRELGPAFDLRAFHDELLARGALPLDILEREMKQWVAARKATPAPSQTP